ncbi:MAG: DinB family protein [Acidobacteriota bacterium]|nr:DinB family protein [Acidobacteriota bacterium]
MSDFSNLAGEPAKATSAYVSNLLALLGDRDPLAVQGELVAALERLTGGMDDAALRRPEAPGKWSVIEVVQHLADSEIVSGYRLRTSLADREPHIQGYDQDRWVSELRYAAADLAEAMAQLAPLRHANLRLLGSLDEERFERFGRHSERGQESVRRLTQLIAAHDLVHRRQIERIKRAIGAAA